MLTVDGSEFLGGFVETTRIQIGQTFIVELVGRIDRLNILGEIDIVVLAGTTGERDKNGDSASQQRGFRHTREFETRHAVSGLLAASFLFEATCALVASQPCFIHPNHSTLAKIKQCQGCFGRP
jgi:hypothetical protein